MSAPAQITVQSENAGACGATVLNDDGLEDAPGKISTRLSTNDFQSNENLRCTLMTMCRMSQTRSFVGGEGVNE